MTYQELISLAMYLRWLYTNFLHLDDQTEIQSSWAEPDDIFMEVEPISDRLQTKINEIGAQLRQKYGDFAFIL